MAFFTFRLDSPATPTAAQSPSGPFTRAPLERSFKSASGSCQSTGDLAADRSSGTFTHEWSTLSAFEEWLAQVEREQVVEFTKQHTNRSMTDSYFEAFQYRCARGHVRGSKQYERKCPDRALKVEHKAAGCKAGLYVKTYYNTTTVLGRFDDTHSHPTGDENARFTRIPLDTRMRIAELLRNGVDPDRVLKEVHDDAARNPAKDGAAARETFVTRADIRRIQKAIEAETVRLDKDDGISTALWVQRWLADGDVLSFKSCNNAPPEGSRLAPNSFHLIIQTDWQRERFAELGGSFAGIDGTHNTTCYENTTLFTVLVRDKWGHGVPIAWMLSSDGTEASLEFFLRTLRQKNPSVLPKRFMTDRDQAQINALRTVYPESELFYCWWHVLHAWQQHFSTHAYPELWELLKTWIRIDCPAKFAERWAQVQIAAPESFLTYLRDYWMSDVQQAMWSAVHRQNRHIHEESDTNMLIEAWHHVLKGKFLNGKRNRRLDTLVCLLHDDVIRHYTLRHRRQLHGFEGPDLEAVARAAIDERARLIRPEDIEHIEDAIYNIRSQSGDGLYTVDLEEDTCSCYSFPRIRFCKHLAAVALVFPEQLPTRDIIVVDASRAADQQVAPASGPSSVGAPVLSSEHVAAKMRRFLARMAVTSAPVPSDVLSLLDSALDDALNRTSDAGVLPKAVAIPPNIKSATETARILPRVKTKRKAGNTLREREPYSGGERSGKKAKSDALHAPAGPAAAVPAAVAAPPLLGASETVHASSVKENIPPVAHGGKAAPTNPSRAVPSGTAPARGVVHAQSTHVAAQQYYMVPLHTMAPYAAQNLHNTSYPVYRPPPPAYAAPGPALTAGPHPALPSAHPPRVPYPVPPPNNAYPASYTYYHYPTPYSYQQYPNPH